MVLIYAYVKKDGNIVTVLPFRYNNGDDKLLECRELILESTGEDTRDSLRDRIVKILDEEKQDVISQDADGQPGRVPNIVTIG